MHRIQNKKRDDLRREIGVVLPLIYEEEQKLLDQEKRGNEQQRGSKKGKRKKGGMELDANRREVFIAEYCEEVGVG